jgi:hypothetical protein
LVKCGGGGGGGGGGDYDMHCNRTERMMGRNKKG